MGKKKEFGHTGKSSCSLASAASKTATLWALEASRLASLALSAALAALTSAKAALLMGRRLYALFCAIGPTTCDAAYSRHMALRTCCLDTATLSPESRENGAFVALLAQIGHTSTRDIFVALGVHLRPQRDLPHSRMDGSIRWILPLLRERILGVSTTGQASGSGLDCTYVLCCSVGSMDHEDNCENFHSGCAMAPPHGDLPHPADQSHHCIKLLIHSSCAIRQNQPP